MELLKRCTNAPQKVMDRLKGSWDSMGAKLKDYRDCTQHFASMDVGHCSMMMTRLDKDVWTARALIPDNPEIKSKRKFSYASKLDAFTYGWRVTNEVVALATDLASAIPKEHKPAS